MQEQHERTTLEYRAAIVWHNLQWGAILRNTGTMYSLEDALPSCKIKRVSPRLVAFMLERYFKDEDLERVTMTLDRDSRPNTFTPYAGLTAAMYKEELFGVQQIHIINRTQA